MLLKDMTDNKFSKAVRASHDYGDRFSHRALLELYGYLLDQSRGDWEFDIPELAMRFAEYNAKDFVRDYGYLEEVQKVLKDVRRKRRDHWHDKPFGQMFFEEILSTPAIARRFSAFIPVGFSRAVVETVS
jgi:hypothetical protein